MYSSALKQQKTLQNICFNQKSKKQTFSVAAEKPEFIKNDSPIVRNEAINILCELNENAQKSFDKQTAKTGWIGKTTDITADILGSHYCKKEIQDDIIQNKADIETLIQAKKDGNFDSKFFDIFGVNYDEKAIKNFKTVFEKNVQINTAKQIAKNNKNALNEYIQFFSENNDLEKIERENSSIKLLPDIDKKINKFEQTLSPIIGGEKLLDNILNQNKEYGVSSRDKKIQVYTELAKSIIEQDNENIKNLKNGKSDLEIKKEYYDSYKKAFGKQNNINKNVTEYALAQKARTYLFKVYSLRYELKGISMLTGALNPLTKTAIRSVSKFAMDTADTATKKEDNKINKEKLKKIAKNSIFSGCTYFSRINLYKVVPKIITGNSLLNLSFNELRKSAINFATGKVRDCIKDKI